MTASRIKELSKILTPADFDALYEDLYDQYLLEPGGESVYSRDLQNNNGSAHSSQRMILCGFRCKRTEVVSQMSVRSGTTAAAATPSLVRYGLYLRRPDLLNYDLVASIANDTSIFSVANTEYVRSFTTPYQKLRGEDYMTAVLVVSAAATPTLLGPIASTLTPLIADGVRRPIKQGVIGAQTDLPATFNISSISGVSPTVSYQTHLLP